METIDDGEWNMSRFYSHVTQSFLAGIVALLPIGGLVLVVAYLEASISKSGLSDMPFYFPGVGLLVAIVFIYLIGLLVTTFIGKWIWGKLDNLLDRLPALGRIYQTLKQILGYGEGKDAIFYETVLVPARDMKSEELGLVTNTVTDAEGKTKLVIFIPGAPNPTSGRLVLADRETVRPLAMPVSDSLKALVSMGKAEIDLRA